MRVPTHGGKVASIPIKAANKTFRVSREPQYKKKRPSNPLTPLNQEKTYQKPVRKKKNSQSVYPEIPQVLPKTIYDDLESRSSQNKSPVVLLVPADRFLDAMDKENISSVPLQNIDYKESRVLNKTLSPIGTPERFSKPLMSCFQSPLPVISKPMKDGNSETTTTQVLSVKDALAVINSDLSCPVSPPNACSSLNLADSLESDDLSMDGKFETAVNIVGDVSPETDVAQPRLTFFVKSNNELDGKPGPEGLMHSPAACSTLNTKFYNGVGDDELNQEGLQPKKILFNSATVIKSKAGASPEHSPNVCKMRTFRRRLLQKVASPESNTGLLEGVSVLPVINSDACVNFDSNVTPPQELEQKLRTQSFQPPTSTHAVQPILTLNDENNANVAASCESYPSDFRVLPFCVTEDMFPVRSCTANQNRKRKSEGYLRDNSVCLPRSLEVKQNSDEIQENKKSCYEKQFESRCKQTHRKITGE